MYQFSFFRVPSWHLGGLNKKRLASPVSNGRGVAAVAAARVCWREVRPSVFAAVSRGRGGGVVVVGFFA